MNIGDLLKSKRKELKYSVKYVTEELRKYNINISVKTLYGWENNYRQPDADTFLILCLIYNISDILNYFTDKTTSEEISNDEKELIKKYRALDERGKKSVYETLERELKYATETQEQSENKVG